MRFKGDDEMSDTTDPQAVTVAQEDRNNIYAIERGSPSFTWPEREAVTEDAIDAALGAYVPGGARVYCWLPMADGDTIHQTARDVMRAAIAGLDKHRLASVSSASAEPTEFIAQRIDMIGKLIERLEERRTIRWNAPDKDGVIHQLVDRQFLIDAIICLDAYRQSLAASPEPVPATNQAGEVELGVYDALKLAHDTLHETTAVLHADDCARVAAVMTQCREALALADRLRTYRPTDEWGDGVHHAICTEAADTIAALATQPATSQEGEAVDRVAKAIYEAGGSLADQNGFIAWADLDGSNDAENFRKMARAAIAATPTPPTLSVDLREAAKTALDVAEQSGPSWLADILRAAIATQSATAQDGEQREAIARALYLRRHPSDYSCNDSYQWSLAKTGGYPDVQSCYDDATAILAALALAQVKAS